MQTKRFKPRLITSLVAGVLSCMSAARAENWLPLPAEPGYEEHGWEYDADSIFVDSGTGFIVVTIMDDMFFMLGADAIDCVNRVEYYSVLPGLDDDFDPDWRNKPHTIGPSDYVYGFANQFCPIRGSLRVGTLQ